MTTEAAKNIIILTLSFILAVVLINSSFITALISAGTQVKMLGIFVAGVFFASLFTAPISVVALGEFALTTSPWAVALIGGAGALVGDLIILLFLKKVMDQGSSFFSRILARRKISAVSESKFFSWLLFVTGAVLIATPLPDELGLMLMGLTRINLKFVIPASFILNSLGIYAIALLAVLATQ
jgi:hypothetical protein